MTISEGLTGRIFDIRRFSTHDGGGIRTTVFMKGCPLRCAWCHNPEGIDFARRPVWFRGKCMGCGSCVEACRDGGVVRLDHGVKIHPEANEDWDAVMDGCPTGALRWDSRDMTIDEVMAELRKDSAFFAHGGGVTLSGGDPLFQSEFAAALLQACRAEGIHTAVETELHAPLESVRAVLSRADLVYADLKLLDGELHKAYTGADNAPILKNLRWLLEGGLRERVIVRTPLIPGMTATEENIAAIAGWLAERYADVVYELLNYNPLAAAKYPLLKREFCFAENPRRFTADEMAAFAEIARKKGLWNVIWE